MKKYNTPASPPTYTVKSMGIIMEELASEKESRFWEAGMKGNGWTARVAETNSVSFATIRPPGTELIIPICVP